MCGFMCVRVCPMCAYVCLVYVGVRSVSLSGWSVCAHFAAVFWGLQLVAFFLGVGGGGIRRTTATGGCPRCNQYVTKAMYPPIRMDHSILTPWSSVFFVGEDTCSSTITYLRHCLLVSLPPPFRCFRYIESYSTHSTFTPNTGRQKCRDGGGGTEETSASVFLHQDDSRHLIGGSSEPLALRQGSLHGRLRSPIIPLFQTSRIIPTLSPPLLAPRCVCQSVLPRGGILPPPLRLSSPPNTF